MHWRFRPVGFADLFYFGSRHHDAVVRGALEVGDGVDGAVVLAVRIVQGHAGPSPAGKLDGPAKLEAAEFGAVDEHAITQLEGARGASSKHPSINLHFLFELQIEIAK